MAKAWTPDEKRELAELVRLLFALSPYRTWDEFAAVAGVSPVSISRWQSALTAPEGYNVLKLLRGSGALEALRAEVTRREKGAQSDRPEDLEAVVTAVTAEVQAGFQKIADILDQDAARTPAAPQPAPRVPRKRKAG